MGPRALNHGFTQTITNQSSVLTVVSITQMEPTVDHVSSFVYRTKDNPNSQIIRGSLSDRSDSIQWSQYSRQDIQYSIISIQICVAVAHTFQVTNFAHSQRKKNNPSREVTHCPRYASQSKNKIKPHTIVYPRTKGKGRLEKIEGWGMDVPASMYTCSNPARYVRKSNMTRVTLPKADKVKPGDA